MASTADIAKNLRKSSTGIKLGRALFDPQYQGKIDANLIASTFRQIGLPFANETRITAASAQIIIAGGAFSTATSATSSIKGFVTPVKAILDGTLELLDAIGLMSKKEPAARGLSFLGAGAMVMASGGLNILADIGFVFELMGFILAQDQPVDMVRVQQELLLKSAEQVKATLIKRIDSQATAAANLFGSYHSGGMSVFQMLGGVAQSAPDLFLKFFPDFNAFIPFTNENVCETTNKVIYTPQSAGANDIWTSIYAAIDSDQWPELNTSRFPWGVIYNQAGFDNPVYNIQSASQSDYRQYSGYSDTNINKGWNYASPNGSKWNAINQQRRNAVLYRANGGLKNQTTISETFCHEVATIKKYQKAELQEIFLRKYVAEPFEPYRFLQSMTLEKLRIYGFPPEAGLKSHPNPVFPRISISDLALLSSLPPYFKRLDSSFDLTKYLIALDLTPNDLGYENFGEDYLPHSDLSQQKIGTAAGVTFNGVDYFSEAQSSYNKAVSKNNYDIQRAIEFDNAGEMSAFADIPNAKVILKEFGTMPWLPADIAAKMYAGREPATRDYRNIQNYWAAISVMDGIRQDPYFQDAKGLSLYRELENQFPSASQFEERHKHLQFTAVAKKLNEQGKKNIALFFGEKDFRKLRFKPSKEGELAQVLPPPIEVRTRS